MQIPWRQFDSVRSFIKIYIINYIKNILNKEVLCEAYLFRGSYDIFGISKTATSVGNIMWIVDIKNLRHNRLILTRSTWYFTWFSTSCGYVDSILRYHVDSYVDYRFGTGTNQYSTRERTGKSTKKNPKYKAPAIWAIVT